MKTVFFIFCSISFIFAQHNIPFASKNNAIELTITNASSIGASDIMIVVSNMPTWLKFANSKSIISGMKANETGTVTFAFEVDKTAPVNKPEKVSFAISNSRGEMWGKTLLLQVSPPEKFELFQNYPNPFNPSTTISYLVPTASNVSLKVYDILGKEVATLDEGMKEPGYHQKEWNAGNIASGMYIYQLATMNSEGKKEFYRKKMLLLK